MKACEKNSIGIYLGRLREKMLDVPEWLVVVMVKLFPKPGMFLCILKNFLPGVSFKM